MVASGWPVQLARSTEVHVGASRCMRGRVAGGAAGARVGAVRGRPRGALPLAGATYRFYQARPTRRLQGALEHAVPCSGHMSSTGGSGHWSDRAWDRDLYTRKIRALESRARISAQNRKLVFRSGSLNRPLAAPFSPFLGIFSRSFLQETSSPLCFPPCEGVLGFLEAATSTSIAIRRTLTFLLRRPFPSYFGPRATLGYPNGFFR